MYMCLRLRREYILAAFLHSLIDISGRGHTINNKGITKHAQQINYVTHYSLYCSVMLLRQVAIATVMAELEAVYTS